MAKPVHERRQPPRKLAPPIRHAPRSQIRTRSLASARLTTSYSAKVVLGRLHVDCLPAQCSALLLADLHDHESFDRAEAMFDDALRQADQLCLLIFDNLLERLLLTLCMRDPRIFVVENKGLDF
jgi:hypothetical protein